MGTEVTGPVWSGQEGGPQGPPPPAPRRAELDLPGMTGPSDAPTITDAAGHPTRGPLPTEDMGAHGHVRRWSLRTRLITLVLAATAAMLVVVDIVLPTVVHNALIDERDASLRSTVAGLPQNIDLAYLDRTVQDNPLRSGIGWTYITPEGVFKFNSPSRQNTGLPSLPSSVPIEPETVVGSNGKGNYRILGKWLNPAEVIIVWTPLDDVDKTVDQLILVELIISVGLLILIGSFTGLIIRRELKPIEDIADAADQIAGGDLSRRVDPGAAGVEVDRLGHAFNGMLDGIEELLAERVANEQRLRQFLADASHELRTPVAAVRGYTDLYRAGALPDESSVNRAMERMGFESKRMAALVEDLLTLARADADTDLPTAPVSLDELLAGVVEDARVIDRTRTWRLVMDGGNYLVAGDRLKLHQVFANLLGNVRTHTPEGTTAVIAVHGESNQVVVEVIDDGPGVGVDDLPKLFDRFYRADPSRSREKGGSGLGLSIVAAIVKSHGGTVQAGRATAGGLAIMVTLPFWQRPESEHAGVAQLTGSG